MQPKLIPTLLAALCLLASPRGAAPGSGDPTLEDQGDLTELSLEELMGIQVTIASKSEQSLSEVPAAVYVLTGDEIRRSGHQTIPDALRMVPGFYVSQWSNDSWDVTSRGFGTGLSLTSLAYLNQLLVLIDGVVVYTPLFAGTWWPLQDIDLADIDRIEIIRGPGGILWGSSAVNGVVHVITKSSADTTGLRLYGRAGNDDRQMTGRFGEVLPDGSSYRVWTKYVEFDTPDSPFLGFERDWNLVTGGFRADWKKGDKDVQVWGRAYDGSFSYEAFDLDFFFYYQDKSAKKGAQVYGSVVDEERGERWQASFSTDQQDIPTLVNSSIETVDLEYNRTFDLSERQSLLVGGGYRLIRSTLEGDDPFWLTFDPEQQTQNIFRAFAVDTIEVTDELQVTAGLSIEHNQFTQFEVQPTLRAAWTPSEDWMAWSSISRSVRTPSLEERSLNENSFYVGSDDFRAEVVWAYELGARKMFGDKVAADLALFYNDFDNMHFGDFDAVLGQTFLTNQAAGEAYGAELALDVQPYEWWKLRSAFTIFQGDYEAPGEELQTDDYHPEQQFNLRSFIDLTDELELDSGVYVVDQLGSDFEIAEYTRVDLRLGWNPSEELQLFIGVQDLGNSTRSEYDEFDNRRRQVYFGIAWQP